MQKYVRIFFLSLLLLILLACAIMPQQDPSARETEVSIAVQQTQLARKSATLDAQRQNAAKATNTLPPTAVIDVQATQAAKATVEAGVAATQKAEASQATRQSATAEAFSLATQQAQPLYDWIQKLSDDGEIASTEGTFHHLEDFEQSVAKINYFNWWGSGYSASDFAILTDMSWDVASKSANWYNTGCGFVFGENEDRVFHFLKISLDGMATLRSFDNSDWKAISQKSFGKPDIPSGKANVLLVVVEKRVKVYIDNKQVLDSYAPLLEPGKISYSLSSGTNAGFGTRCKLTNVGLWIFKK